MTRFKRYGEAGKYLNLLLKSVIVMLTSILICFGIGYTIIKKTKAAPAWIIAFIFLGILLSFYYLYRAFKKLE